jgi:hypothetical protein
LGIILIFGRLIWDINLIAGQNNQRDQEKVLGIDIRADKSRKKKRSDNTLLGSKNSFS